MSDWHLFFIRNFSPVNFISTRSYNDRRFPFRGSRSPILYKDVDPSNEVIAPFKDGSPVPVINPIRCLNPPLKKASPPAIWKDIELFSAFLIFVILFNSIFFPPVPEASPFFFLNYGDIK